MKFRPEFRMYLWSGSDWCELDGGESVEKQTQSEKEIFYAALELSDVQQNLGDTNEQYCFLTRRFGTRSVPYEFSPQAPARSPT